MSLIDTAATLGITLGEVLDMSAEERLGTQRAISAYKQQHESYPGGSL